MGSCPIPAPFGGGIGKLWGLDLFAIQHVALLLVQRPAFHPRIEGAIVFLKDHR